MCNQLYDLFYFACRRPKMAVKLIVKLIIMFTSHHIDFGSPKSSARVPKGAQEAFKSPRGAFRLAPKSNFGPERCRPEMSRKSVARKKDGTNSRKHPSHVYLTSADFWNWSCKRFGTPNVHFCSLFGGCWTLLDGVWKPPNRYYGS